MNRIEKKVATHYGEKFKTYGATPKGVDWKDQTSQHLRFEQLLKVLNPISPDVAIIKINDLGCGYAEFYDYLIKHSTIKFEYNGYDISKPCIEYLQRQRQVENKHFDLIVDVKDLKIADYTVASGIFNVKMDETEEDWLNYILQTIKVMDEKSTKGFAFNCLTSYSDTHKKRADLYYADPLYLFDYIKKNIAQNLVLYHDYGLYDFTIVVRKSCKT
jgi:hypothetical protein